MVLLLLLFIALLIVADACAALRYLDYLDRRQFLLRYEDETEARMEELNAMLDRLQARRGGDGGDGESSDDSERERLIEKKYKMLLSLLERYRVFVRGKA